MKNRIHLVTMLCFLLWVTTAPAQPNSSAMTLKEVLQYSLKENTDIKKQNLALIKSQYATKEVRSQGLPQINGSVQVMNNLQLQEQYMPGEIIGEPGTTIPMEVGSHYGVPFKAEWSQLIYSQAYIVSMQQARAGEDLTKVNAEKVQQEVIYKVASAFYQTLITGEQLNLIQANLDQINQSLRVVQSQYENQMARKIDLDQLKVNQSNTRTDLDNATIAYSQYLDYLKIVMGYPLQDTLVLTGSVTDENVVLQNSTFNNPMLSVLEMQETVQALEIKGIQAKYLPSLSSFGQYAYQSQFDEWNGTSMQWSSSSYIGASVSIPIFDGLQKHQQLQQSKIELKSMELDRKFMQDQLNSQYLNAKRNYLLNQKSIKDQEDNLQLATDVYDATQNNYQNGIASLSDLINADSGLKSAQTLYLTSLLQSKISALDIMNANGNLNDLLK